MIFVFANLVSDAIEQLYKFPIVTVVMGNPYRPRDRGPCLCYLFKSAVDILFFPFACVVIRVSQDVAGVYLAPIYIAQRRSVELCCRRYVRCRKSQT